MVSYTTVSPLPAPCRCANRHRARRSVLCGTGLRVTPSGRYPPPCPAEPGRSSSHLRDARPPGQPIRCSFYGLPPAAPPVSPGPIRGSGGRMEEGPEGSSLPGRARKGSDPMNFTAVIVLVVVVVLLLMLARMSIRIVRQYEQGVLFRLGRVVGVRMPGPALHHPGDRQASAGQPADRDDADPVAGHHHPGQRQRGHLRRGLLPRDRRREVRRGDRERGRGDQPDRPDHAAEGGRPAQPGPDAVRDASASTAISAKSSTPSHWSGASR